MSTSLLTKDEVAARLNVAPRTVLDFAARGVLASVRLGRCVRFERAAVDSFIVACRRMATPVPPPTPVVRPSPLPAPRKDYFA